MNVCKECGGPAKAKFCTRSCSAKFNNRGHNRHGTVKGNCKECGSKLGRSAQTYCSVSCQQVFAAKKALADGTASASTLKRVLIREQGLKCSICGWAKINPHSGKCPVQLDHIDGNSDNNARENGRLLCPNCHSLTSTWGSLNPVGNGRRVKERLKSPSVTG